MSPPLFEVECLSCGARYEELLRNTEAVGGEPCRQCHVAALQMVLTAHQGYTIKGNNGASQRPASAGSFKRNKG